MVCTKRTFLKMCIILMMCPKRIRPDSYQTSGESQTAKENPKSLDKDEMNEFSNNSINNAHDVESIHDKLLDLSESEMTKFKIWALGVIPYFIDEFSFDKVLRDRIRRAMDIFIALTGIQFTELPQPPADDDTRWVFLVNRMGQLDCIDHPTSSFTNQGVQKIVLGYDCLQETSNMAPIFLSLIGVPPQHNAPNRDDYIEIVNENILPNKMYLFKKLSESDWLFNDHPYDFASASHYDFHAYTANGLATIRPKKAIDEAVGEVKGLSKYDIRKVKMLYSNQLNKQSSMKVAQCSKLYKPAAKYSLSEPIDSKMHPESVKIRGFNIGKFKIPRRKPRPRPPKKPVGTEKGNGNNIGNENTVHVYQENNYHLQENPDPNSTTV